ASSSVRLRSEATAQAYLSPYERTSFPLAGNVRTEGSRQRRRGPGPDTSRVLRDRRRAWEWRSPSRRARSALDALVQQAQQVAAVGVGRAELARQRLELLGADPALAVGPLLGAGDPRALAGLERLDEDRGLQQALVRAGVAPRHAAAEELDAQAALLQVDPGEVGDHELPAR